MFDDQVFEDVRKMGLSYIKTQRGFLAHLLAGVEKRCLEPDIDKEEGESALRGIRELIEILDAELVRRAALSAEVVQYLQLRFNSYV